MKNKTQPARPVETQAQRFARLNKSHSSFVVQLHSPMKGQFVDRAKDALHDTIEGAKEIVEKFKVCKWQILGFHNHHKEWHPVLAGQPVTE